MIDEKTVKNNNVTDIIKTPKKSIIPRSEKQKNYVRALKKKMILLFQQDQLGLEKLFCCSSWTYNVIGKKMKRIISIKTSS